MTFEVALPLPPSVNGMFVQAHANSKFGKSLSETYKAWRNGCAVVVKAAYKKQDSPVIGQPYAVHIRLNVDHKSDIDNRVKPILDLLTKAIPIPGDQWISRILVERDRTIDGAHVEIVSLP